MSVSYPYFVQIQQHQDLVQHTREFLESQADRPLEQCTVGEINEFLWDCYRRAQYQGEAYGSACRVPS